MKQIEFERWEPDAENPRRLTYAGQRTAEDVFHELEAQLDSVGYLPDEYFSMDWRWEHGRQIPKGADFFCKTDYGGSEGIYLDVYLEWQEGDKPKKECFITGKTLGESGADLDRMFLISSGFVKEEKKIAFTLAFSSLLFTSSNCSITFSSRHGKTCAVVCL